MKCLWTASINCSLDGLGLASCLAIAELNIIGTVDSRPLIWESKLYLRDWSGANISTAQSVLACSGQLSAEFIINTSAKMQRYKLQKQCGANIVEQWLRLKLHWGIDIDYCGMIVEFQPNDSKHTTQGRKSHRVSSWGRGNRCLGVGVTWHWAAERFSVESPMLSAPWPLCLWWLCVIGCCKKEGNIIDTWQSCRTRLGNKKLCFWLG